MINKIFILQKKTFTRLYPLSSTFMVRIRATNHTTCCSQWDATHDLLQPVGRDTRLAATSGTRHTTCCSQWDATNVLLQPVRRDTRLAAASGTRHMTCCSQCDATHDLLQPVGRDTRLAVARGTRPRDHRNATPTHCMSMLLLIVANNYMCVQISTFKNPMHQLLVES